jgi:flagellar biosynthetic protein FlhB
LILLSHTCRPDNLITSINLQLFANEEKTEPATPHRRREARRKGQVFHSMEFTAAVNLLLAGTCTLLLLPWWRNQIVTLTQTLYRLHVVDFGVASMQQLGYLVLTTILQFMAPLFGVVVISGIAANLAQVGFVFSLDPIAFRLERLNPISGLQRMFSWRSAASLVRSLAKLFLVAGVVYLNLKRQLHLIPRLPLMGLNSYVDTMRQLVWGLLWQCGLAILFLAAADYAYQRWEYEKSLKMSVPEVKEEFKQLEGSPELRSHIRERQRQLSRARMMHRVPEADVIITNPRHYAIALKYDARTMGAPMILAKGAGLIAERIKDIARKHAILMVENKPLAQSLYRSVEVGDDIPVSFYQAVAEVLAYVYRQRGLI